ncbi:MAG: CinA family nicotinamide mononucleotide deamidase-related protein [Rikenellaceae bacterium]
MNVSIITIGDEILIGQIVDTNSAFIAQRLSALGFVVESKLSIGDGAEQITSVIGDALCRCDLVVVTGGLGPTKDDITKGTLAEMYGCTMRNDERVARHVEQLMTSRGVTYNELNRQQSHVPECCEVLFNAHGTAPGMWFAAADGRGVLVSLPGVPFEMKRLIEDVVEPRLLSEFTLKKSLHRTLITVGVPESMLAERIEAWESGLPEYLKLAYLPSAGRVRLRLSAYEVEDAVAVRSEVDRQFAAVEQLLLGHILGYEGITAERVVHDRLRERGESLAIAESCTGGALSAKFTAMAGASEYLLGSVVAYGNGVKISVLGVSPETLAAHGAVSEAVAIEMADGVRRLTGADYAISTTGIAGPTGGSDEKPVGTVWFGISSAAGSFALMRRLGTDRSQVIDRSVAEALAQLRALLVRPTLL